MSFDDLLERVDRALVLTSQAFDFPARVPANVEYVGPQLEPAEPTPAWASPWPPEDERPLVVVGLSTTYQAHDPLLERIVAALATLPVRALVTTGGMEASVDATRQRPPRPLRAPRQVLPQAAAVVTHAGLGTVHAALAHGLPLVCLPIGRDQPDNAARVEWHGAGLRLSPKSPPVGHPHGGGAGPARTGVLGLGTPPLDRHRRGAPSREGNDGIERVADRSRSTEPLAADAPAETRLASERPGAPMTDS